MPQETLNTREAAKALGISKRTLARWNESGQLKPEGLNHTGYRKYTRAQIEALGGEIPEDPRPAWHCKNCGAKHILEIDMGLRLAKDNLGPTCVEYGPPKESVCA